MTETKKTSEILTKEQAWEARAKSTAQARKLLGVLLGLRSGLDEQNSEMLELLKNLEAEAKEQK